MITPPQANLFYAGTYRFSINLGGLPPVWLAFGGVTTDKNAAGAFAQYTMADNTHSVLQAIPADPAQWRSRWFSLTNLQSGNAGDIYPTASLGSPIQFVCDFTSRPGSVSFWIPDANGYLSSNDMRGLRLWIIGRDSFWGVPYWTVETLNTWGVDQANPDLQGLLFDGRVLLGPLPDLRHAKLSYASLLQAWFLAKQMQNADLTHAFGIQACFSMRAAWGLAGSAGEIPETNLTEATFADSTFLAASFQGCNLTRARFANAILTPPVPIPVPGYDTSFAGATLDAATFASGNDLSGVDFTGASLKGTELAGTKLQRAQFVRADLTGADLSGCDLTGADFTGATLVRTKMPGATVDASTTFTGAVMMGADFTGCNLTLPSFSTPASFYTGTLSAPTAANPRTCLRNAHVPLAVIGHDWSWLDLGGATIDGRLPDDLTGFKADYAIFPDNYALPSRTLNSASFRYAIMHGVELRGGTAPTASPVDFTGADLTSARMSKMSLKKATFELAWLTGANLSSSVLDTAIFSNAHLETKDGLTVDLSYCSLTDAVFTGAFLNGSGNLPGANLSYVLFWGLQAKLDGATIAGARFDNAFLTGLDFQKVDGTKLAGTSFTGACLVSAKFAGTALTNVGLSGACLQGADFAGATLYGAQMTNAAIATAAGEIAITGNAKLPPKLKYLGTTIRSQSTNGATICPNGDNGQCSGVHWTGRNAPMTTWVAPPALTVTAID